MQNSIKLMFLSFSLFTSIANATDGFYLDMDNPPQTCTVLARVGSDFLDCSGTLVAPNKVITAGHCLSKMKSDGLRVFNPSNGDLGAVSCNKHKNDQDNSEKSSAILAVDFFDQDNMENFKFEDGDKYPRDKDMAVITLKNDIDLAPMAYTLDPVRSLELIESGECRLSGFGSGTMPDGKRHPSNLFQHTIRPPKNMIFVSDEVPVEEEKRVCHFKGMEDYMGTPTVEDISNGMTSYLTKGDSGGSYFCKDDKTQSWTLVGVNIRGSDKPMKISETLLLSSNAISQWLEGKLAAKE